MVTCMKRTVQWVSLEWPALTHTLCWPLCRCLLLLSPGAMPSSSFPVKNTLWQLCNSTMQVLQFFCLVFPHLLLFYFFFFFFIFSFSVLLFDLDFFFSSSLMTSSPFFSPFTPPLPPTPPTPHCLFLSFFMFSFAGCYQCMLLFIAVIIGAGSGIPYDETNPAIDS